MTASSWDEIDPGHLTRMINRAHEGDAAARAELLPLVYRELKRIAAQQRRHQGRGSEMLNTTAVVNEAWLRLHDVGGYQNRRHFLAVAATAMRQLLIDEARRQLMQKRGGGSAVHVTLGDHVSVEDQAEWLISLDQALDALDAYNPRLRNVFQLRFFAGLTEIEAAEVLEVSESTVRRDWLKAKAMLAVVL
jgi:RNA polymerase sigma factor (TIGR02999 family)